LVSTCTAIVLGVAFTTATFVLATTLDRAARRRSQGPISGSSDLRFFQALLEVFGVVALLVGAFVIANTFSILVAQRTRELGLLRLLGASRAQVFGSVLGEAAIVGSLASVGGLFLGRWLASLLRSTMNGLGLGLPRNDLVVRADTLALSVALGIGVTLAAALLPALRATRVPPIAALREAEPAPVRGRAATVRLVAGLVASVGGALRCAPAWRDGADTPLVETGVGAVLVVGGVLLLGPRGVRPGVGLLGRAVRGRAGTVGRLALQNAARHPGRTATSAGAVVISSALVVFVAAFAASAAESVRSDAERGFVGDLVVTGPAGLTLPNGLLTSSIPSSVLPAVQSVPGVELAVGVGYARGRLELPDGSVVRPYVTAIDRAGLGTLLLPRMREGSIEDLDDDGIVLDRTDAQRHGATIGDHVEYSVPGGAAARLRVAGISDDPNLLGHATVTRDRYAAVAPTVHDVQVFGSFAPGADPDAVLARVRAAVASTPDVYAFDREGFVQDVSRQIASFINVIYALLALSVLISITGVANTMSLTIHERTRELGLLRAIGMDRTAVRASVRWEAVAVGLLGTGVGVLLGAAVSLAVISTLRELGLVTFALPARQVAAVVLGGIVLTTLAAVRPARRAASASILDAISAA
jgi:putative ABC transport system permease protein